MSHPLREGLLGPRVVSPHPPQGLQGSHLNLSQTSAQRHTRYFLLNNKDVNNKAVTQAPSSCSVTRRTLRRLFISTGANRETAHAHSSRALYLTPSPQTNKTSIGKFHSRHTRPGFVHTSLPPFCLSFLQAFASSPVTWRTLRRHRIGKIGGHMCE